MHVQVDVDQRTIRDHPRGGAVAGAAVVAPRDQLPVDLLELIGGVPEAEPLIRARGLFAQPRPQLRLAREPVEACGQRLGIAGGVLQASTAIAQQLRVNRDAAGDRRDSAHQCSQEHVRRRPHAIGPEHRDVGAGEHRVDVAPWARRIGRARPASG